MMRGAVMLVMDGIKEFEFNEHGLQKLKELPNEDSYHSAVKSSQKYMV